VSLSDHLQPGEEILYRAHPSRLPLVPPLALAAVAAVGGLVGWKAASGGEQGGSAWILVLVGAIVVAALVWALVRYVRLAANHYVLTNRRLLRLSGVLSQASMDSYLDKINNVKHRQSLTGRLLGFGDLEIDTASDTGAEVFPRIANPVGFKRAIDAATSAFHAAAAAGRPAAPPPVAAPAAAPAAPPAATTGADRLRDLKRLLDDGLISQAEFDAKRQQILDKM
jgi:uncharacterized membrane protein YdbT with pleckstrin-like domain